MDQKMERCIVCERSNRQSFGLKVISRDENASCMVRNKELILQSKAGTYRIAIERCPVCGRIL